MPSADPAPYLPPATQPVRGVVWAIHLVLPMLGLWLLLANDKINIPWQHNPSHFWSILAVAGVNVALGLMISEAARRRGDARLFLVSMVFLSSAGFFFMHGLATPGFILRTGSLGFDAGQQVGLSVAALFAFASALPLGERAAGRVLAAQHFVRAALLGFMLVWGLTSLTPGLTPLSEPPAEAPVPWLAWGSLPGLLAYAAASVMMFLIHRRRPSAMLISLITAYALLAESMVAGMSQHNWHLSWWEWHLLLTLAFVFVAYSSYLQFRREGSSAGLFDSVALSATVRRIRQDYDRALEELVEHVRRGEPLAATRLSGKFRLNEGQAAVLDRAGRALAEERELSVRLAALVDVSGRTKVGLPENELLASSLERVRQAYGDVRIALVADGRTQVGSREYAFTGDEPIRRDHLLAFPLTVKGKLAGVLEVPIGRTSQDEALAATLAGQLSISLENARLYQELHTLFHQYMSPDVAHALLADPAQAALGGELRELTALFADLKGFTTFSEKVTPGEIVEMLNRYHTAAVPCILDNGGTIVQFVGDALLALFNAPAAQADHARAACRAALAMQQAAAEVAEEMAWKRVDDVPWPTFRVGVNTGPALVGNIGSPELRGFNAMGDCVNVAARLEGVAVPGTVVIGETTLRHLGEGASVRPLGDLSLKGKEELVTAYVLTDLA
ncbi:adenylate/guanylate cyclase domain-containing protein [Actinomadura sp. ATCC 31491]|uniref:Adenylate/guanylate cyclase domain-containing protein n=1 Tax=Actinomadura luzonensis TaxID=2805427 RepID=A0ABT0FP10_9ACTN|nr:adenylate/guanylate cyclase domain-containing protein [Actinomadura luzonensis]MCK2213631.1 adenylate/guanylate cyclase domain-containing protein [Actinomadura luzonensis]